MTRHKTQDTRHRRNQWQHTIYVCLVSCLLCLVSAVAGQLPSLFRGVVVADSAHGVRVVSVEEHSQAFLADLRPEDLILQVNHTPMRTIDEFATLSSQLKGVAVKATLVIVRNGEPRELVLHLYSYPVLRQWDLAFVPDDDMKFVEPRAGLSYWARMGRGYETVGDLEAALSAYLNGLHNEPTFVDAAFKVSDLLWQIAQQRLAAKNIGEAMTALQAEVRLLHRLFEQPMTEEDLQRIKGQLERTIAVIHQYRHGLAP